MALPPLVCFHKNCMDGRGAAAVFKRKYPNAEFHAIQWGMKRPDNCAGRDVVVVDVAFELEEMQALAAEATSVTWLDHHRSSLPLRDQLGFGEFNEAECGATMAWQHCYGDQELPPILEYIKDRDLWLWRMPESRAVSAALAERFPGDRFAGLLELDIAELQTDGRVLWQRIQERVQASAKRGREVDQPFGLRGVRGLAVNSLDLASELGEHIYLPVADGGLGYDLAILFAMRGDGRWVHSLRSITVDCERIASSRGGGGHPSAAGYVADEPFVSSIDAW